MSPFKLFFNNKKTFLYFLLILKLIFIPSSAISKIVGNKIFIGTTFSLTGENSSASNFFKNKIDKLFEKYDDIFEVYNPANYRQPLRIPEIPGAIVSEIKQQTQKLFGKN